MFEWNYFCISRKLAEATVKFRLNWFESEINIFCSCTLVNLFNYFKIKFNLWKRISSWLKVVWILKRNWILNLRFQLKWTFVQEVKLWANTHTLNLTFQLHLQTSFRILVHINIPLQLCTALNSVLFQIIFLFKTTNFNDPLETLFAAPYL